MSDEKRRKRSRRGLAWRLVAASLVAAGAAAWAGAVVPALSLFAHFHPHYAAAWAALLLAMALLPSARGAFWRPGRVAACGILLLALHAVPPLLLYWPDEQPQFEHPDVLDVVWANLMRSREAAGQLSELLAADPPDVLALAEIPDGASIALPGYEHELRDTRHDLRLLSRHPLERRRLRVTGEGGRNVLMADCLVGRRVVTLLVAHARQPFYEAHHAELRVLAALAAGREHALVFGDLNTTPWAADFRRLLRDGGLRHARAGHGVIPSWAPPGLRWLALPIDHVLYRGAVALESHEPLPWILSDHRPLRSSFLLGMKHRLRPGGGD